MLLVVAGYGEEVTSMRELALVSSLLMMFCMIPACNDTGTNPENAQGSAKLYQIEGCQRTGVEKSFPGDSCFSYMFTEDLTVDFCVSANCCPDSNRFALSYKISGDTIAAAIADTAANLCRCTCTYVIHAEFSRLRLDRYVLVCTYEGITVYKEGVYRTR